MARIATALRRDTSGPHAGTLMMSSLGRTILSHAAALPAMLVLALVIRLALIPLGSYQIDAALMSGWAQRLTTEPLLDFYMPAAPNYGLPGELWLLWATGNVFQLVVPGMGFDGFPFLFALKLIP